MNVPTRHPAFRVAILSLALLITERQQSLGLARELLIRIVDSEDTLVLSNEMLYELARVLRYPRLRKFYALSETLIYDYITFLRHCSDIVILNPLVTAPIRDVNDVVVMQTAIIGEADILCTKDEDFFGKPAREYLENMGIAVMDEIDLMKQLRR